MFSAEYLSKISIDLIMTAFLSSSKGFIFVWKQKKNKKPFYRMLTFKPGRKTRLQFMSCPTLWIFYWPKQTKSTTAWWVLLKWSFEITYFIIPHHFQEMLDGFVYLFPLHRKRTSRQMKRPRGRDTTCVMMPFPLSQREIPEILPAT